MIKVIGLFKRRPGMTVTQFRDYYESKHRVIGEKYLAGYASKYQRRYLKRLPGAAPDSESDSDYDVALEIWYADQAAFSAAGARLSEPDIAREIAADEAQLFDRDSMRVYIVDEFESALPALD